MKKLALTVTLLALWAVKVLAAEFFCSSGDVTCLIDAINSANGMPGANVINLEPGRYTLQAAIDEPENGLPEITSSIRIQPTSEDIPTVIERDPNARRLRMFEVSADGELTLDGITLQGGGPFRFSQRPAISNGGVTSLQDSSVIDFRTDIGVIRTGGTLRVIRSIIASNFAQVISAGIVNFEGGNVVVENSTFANNISQGTGGIDNSGSLVVKNSAIIFSSTAISNGGTAEIINSTIAKNGADGFFLEAQA